MAGQAAVIREALNISQVSPDTIGYIEAHGTGTEIGDPMEISALTRVFREKTDRKRFCAVGSVKANIGHLDTAAGVASLIKTVMALKHNTLPPSPNFREPNPRINFLDSPFFVNDTPKKWVRNSHPRRAGVSSFGFGGTNAHVILQEPPDHPSTQASQYQRHLLTLSAKTLSALTQQIHNYHHFLGSNPDVSMEEICFTANTGRSHFRYRFAAVAASKDDLHLQLTAAIQGKTLPTIFQDVTGDQAGPKVTFNVTGHSFNHDQLTDIASDAHALQNLYRLPVMGVDKDESKLLLSALGNLYVHGADIDWDEFYQDCRYYRIQLPAYPFERKRYWADKTQTSVAAESDTDSAENGFHEVLWQEKEHPKIDANLSEKSGSWLIFADKGGVGLLLAEKLRVHGNECVLVFTDNVTAEFSHVFPFFNFEKLEAYQELFEIFQERSACRGIIYLWALDAVSSEAMTSEWLKASQDLVCGSVFRLVQSMRDLKWPGPPPRLCLVTQGAQSVDQEDASIAVAQAPLWGLGKVIGVEHPELNCLRLDMDPVDAKPDVDSLFNELYALDPESQVAFRANRRYVPRIVKTQIESINEKDNSPDIFHNNATYLITGGLGALGIEIARWMADQKAGHIVLVSRRQPGEEAEHSLAALRKKVDISVLSADVTEPDQLVSVFTAIENNHRPLKGIIHAAGVLEPGASIDNEKYDNYLKVTAPKIQGAWNLHQLSRPFSLDFFICFSSVASLWGIHGMASYTAANMFLDALSYYRRSMGLKGTTINWGPWSDIGVVAEYNMSERLAIQGIGTILPAQGLSFLKKVIQNDFSQIGVLCTSWNKVIRQYQNKAEINLFNEVEALQADESTPPERTPDLLNKLREISSSKRMPILLDYLRDQASKILRTSKSKISGSENLMQLGMDSLLFLELSKIMETDLETRIPPRHFIQSPYIESLGKFIIENMEDPETDHSKPKEGFSIVPDPDNRYKPFGLTDIQHAYWIGRSGVTELGDVACHVYFEIEAQALDLERYTAAWQQVVSRHDMLRAIILPDGRQQVLEDPPLFQVHVRDLRGDAPDLILQEKMLIREEMSHQVRPADQWPLFEVRATLMDDRSTLLHISIDILIADGYSIYNLLQEIDHYYRMPDKDLAPIECTFRDYVLAESAFRESDTYLQAEQYWMDKLETLSPPPELPLAKSPSELETTRFVRREARLPPKAWEQLQSYASQSGLTRANVLLSAYAEVLATWSKSREFTLNLTFFHRLQGHPRINEVVGDFTSLTLLQVDAASGAPFMERTRNIQAQLWKDMEFRYFSGVRVLQELSRKNPGSQRVLMPVVFTSNLGYESLRPESTGLSLPGKLVYSISQTPQVWIDNQISEDENGLVIVWDAVEELFPEGMLDDMFNAYHSLLRQLSQSLEVWHTTPELLPETQIQRCREVNATAQPVSAETLNSLFIKQAEQQPDYTAVITSSGHISYKDLYHKSMVIASLLAARGALANTLVAVVMEKGWEQVAAVLGVLNTGAAYLPIDPAVPRERLWHLLEDGEVKSVLTQSWLDRTLEWPKDVEVCCVDTLDYTLKDLTSVHVKQIPDDLAYVIHTSGSTGFPKGVMIDHKGAVNTILDINNRYHLTPRDRVFALSNLNFDLSVYDIFGTLAAGATIVMPDDALLKDPGHWLSLIKEEHVTVWNSVPALMQMLVEYVSGRDDLLFDTLRLVLLSGDWIPLDLPDKIKEWFDTADIISLGGATEASIWSILYSVDTVDSNWNSIPYGRPMVNQNFYVLNENMDTCPDWVPGQLYIGGTGLAKGYWRDEEKTKASFIQNSKTGIPLYRTGDLGRFLPDGNIEFLGREDQQVKINGYRIELGEIESGLKQIQGITDAVVVPVADRKKNRYLAGHIIAEPEYGYTDKDIKQKLAQTLPGYMVPGFYLFHDAFPVTANGKIDRKRLADPANISFQKNNAAIVNPENETEQTISDIIKDLLCLETVSTKSLFSEIGATSMHFVQMQNKLNEVFSKNVSVVNIFEYPTISSLAQFISETDYDSGAGDRTDKRIAIRKRLKKRNPGLMTR
jgi:amino acid adenylation domain-containing protein